MLRLIALVVSVGLADSMNPSTVGPALHLASGTRSRRRLAQFTFGVLAVYFVGGAVIALGPGQVLLSLVPRPGAKVRHICETAAGVVMLIAAAFLWHDRESHSRRGLPTPRAERSERSARRHDHRRRASNRLPVLRGALIASIVTSRSPETKLNVLARTLDLLQKRCRCQLVVLDPRATASIASYDVRAVIVAGDRAQRADCRLVLVRRALTSTVCLH